MMEGTMSVLAKLPQTSSSSEGAPRIDWICDAYQRSRFVPCPPAERCFVGDGDFRAIGAEFLKRFVLQGDLAPHERVLDIGSGIGRMALPLTQYLEAGTYDGIEIVDTGVEWCRENISPAYDAFRFHRLDLRHPLYNPGGAMRTEEVRLPFADASFDFILLVSLLTHLEAAETAAYAREIRRVAAPGARVFLTAFLMNPPARAALEAGKGKLPFDGTAKGPVSFAYPDTPSAAVAYDEDFLLATFLEVGLRRKRPAVYGAWSGRAGETFQDISIFEIYR